MNRTIRYARSLDYSYAEGFRRAGPYSIPRKLLMRAATKQIAIEKEMIHEEVPSLFMLRSASRFTLRG
jgi:hypothetical protein